MNNQYLSINRENWNKRTAVHLESSFYDNPGFIAGKNSLKAPELVLLGDVRGKSILHLQCHFGQDTISLSRMGALATGIDLSDQAIAAAKRLAQTCGTDTRFVCSDVYDLPNHLSGQFDIVFTSYGTIGWLPDLDKWAQVIMHFLAPGGRFVMADFHPVVWMFDDDFTHVKYPYFKGDAIIEHDTSTYGNPEVPFSATSVGWNHSTAELLTALLGAGLQLESYQEFDYSPFDCFKHTIKLGEDCYRISHLANKIPMMYALTARKN